MGTEPVDILSRRIRGKVILKYLGQLAVVQAALILVIVLVSLFFGEYEYTRRYAVLIALLLLYATFTRHLPTEGQLQTNEAYVLVALTFILSPLLMAVPLSLDGITLVDAIFECISGITTTGLSTLATVQDKSHTLLFTRAWMQWYGGLGIVVLSLALIADHRLARRQFMDGLDRQHLVSETRSYARSMLIVYCWLTVIGILLLWLILGKGFDALLLTFSAVSTGGFAPYNDSLLSLSVAARFVVITLSTLGAIALPIYLLLWRRRWQAVLLDAEVQVFFALVLTISSALALLRILQFSEPMIISIREGIFLGLSAQSTTGFASYPSTTLDSASKFLVIVAMFIGGGLGSTAGGIKVMRLIMLGKVLFNHLQRSALPTHAINPIRIGKITIADSSVQQALILFLIMSLLIVASWWPFIKSGHDPLNSLFEVVSAIGTVGLSVGITRPELSAGLKSILMIDMLAGRLEVFALLILVYPRTWFSRKESQ